MKRRLSKQEKKLLKSLIRSDKNTFGLIDFFAFGMPKGKFEISTFQQAISLQVTEAELPALMNHLVARFSLLKDLEHAGYTNVWNQLPIEDNTKVLGEPSPDSKIVFIPDINIAAELLKYGNYQISFNDALIDWSKRNFKESVVPNSLKFAIYALLIVISLDLLYDVQIIGKNIRSDHQTIVDNNQEVIENQKLNKRIIDSLKAQSEDLVAITGRISDNTENIGEVEQLISYQNRSVRNIQNQLNSLERQLIKNARLIQRSDSLVNLTPKPQ